jgi:glycerophosphoryl diester phosphodiesterase
MKYSFLLSILFILTTACDSNMKKPLRIKPPKHGGVYVVAHRGAHNGIPENSLPAYQKAIELGCDFVEVDVRTTNDGKLVCIHNSTIDAYVDDDSGRVKDFTLNKLQKFDIGSKISSEWKGTKIPTFEKVLELCQGKIGVYLDLKDAQVEPIVRLVKKFKMENDVLWYANRKKLEQVKKLCPKCVIMPDPGPEENIPGIIQKLNPGVIAPVWRNYSKSYVEKCHQSGAIVIVDERDPDSWQQALEWGSDGIQTDFPEELIDFLKNE